jgi:colicin import membrane protein
MQRLTMVACLVLGCGGVAMAQQVAPPAQQAAAPATNSEPTIEELLKQREKQLAKIRAKRKQAQEDAAIAEVALANLGVRTPPVVETAPYGPGSRAAYLALISNTVRENWARPDGLPENMACPVRIQQGDGGVVLHVDVLPQCPFDDAGKRSIEAAVMKSSPLPYVGYETVFVSDLLLKFVAN